MKQAVFGQDEAINSVARAIKLARSGLSHPDKPVGAFLFAGPTGVGKTEVARQLAKVMGVEFIRFDMSEYMERHTVSRLIGAPPGYVGFDQGGLLTDVDQQDAALRAAARRDRKGASRLVQHPAAGDGSRDAHRQQRAQGGFPQRDPGDDDQRRRAGTVARDDRIPRRIGQGDPKNVLERMFSPEFRNRLSATIDFAPLSPETMERVVDKFIAELQERLDKQKVTLTVTPAAKKWLAEHGHDPALRRTSAGKVDRKRDRARARGPGAVRQADQRRQGDRRPRRRQAGVLIRAESGAATSAGRMS